MPNRAKLPDDPDAVRMPFTEHLEELRKCVLRAVIGVAVATVLCFHYGDRIIHVLTAPYVAAMRAQGFDGRLVQLGPPEAFLEYFKIAVEFGLVLSIPWVIYQIWRFVALGLYPNERKVIRYFAPASVGLFLLGASFMVGVVLFGLLRFLISISAWFSSPGADSALVNWFQGRTPPAATTQQTVPPLRLPVLDGDPAAPSAGDAWVRRSDHTLQVMIDGQRYTTSLHAAEQEQLVQPLFNISEYLSFVTGMALAFGLGFQVPIVVIFLMSTGIVTSQMFSEARRYIILGIAIAAAIVTPSPDMGSMLLLMVPMVILFESGVLIGRILERRRESGKHTS